jgi:methylase of polypeptide subunit release factors
VIEKLFERVPSVLKDKGHLVLEMASGQEAEVSTLGKAYGWERSDLRRDLAGINRCAIFRRG